MTDGENPIAWTDEQVRMLILMHEAELDGLTNMLIAKGAITADELSISVEASTNTIRGITTVPSASGGPVARRSGAHRATGPGRPHAVVTVPFRADETLPGVSGRAVDGVTNDV